MKINLEAFNLELLQKSLLSEEEKKVLLRLWNDEYPIIISHSSLQSFNHYLDSLENVTHYLLMDLSYNIIKRNWTYNTEISHLKRKASQCLGY